MHGRAWLLPRADCSLLGQSQLRCSVAVGFLSSFLPHHDVNMARVLLLREFQDESAAVCQYDSAACHQSCMDALTVVCLPVRAAASNALPAACS